MSEPESGRVATVSELEKDAAGTRSEVKKDRAATMPKAQKKSAAMILDSGDEERFVAPMEKPRSGRSLPPAKSPSLIGVVVRDETQKLPPILKALPKKVLARIFDYMDVCMRMRLLRKSKPSGSHRLLTSPPGLLLTCKEIQFKLIEHYYSSSTIYIQHQENPGCKLPLLTKLLAKIGQPRAGLVGNIHIRPKDELQTGSPGCFDEVSLMRERCKLANITIKRGEHFAKKSKKIHFRPGVFKSVVQVVSKVTSAQRAARVFSLSAATSRLPEVEEWTADPDELFRQWQAGWLEAAAMGVTFKWPGPVSDSDTLQC